MRISPITFSTAGSDSGLGAKAVALIRRHPDHLTHQGFKFALNLDVVLFILKQNLQVGDSSVPGARTRPYLGCPWGRAQEHFGCSFAQMNKSAPLKSVTVALR
ncbi:hypothetical protein [Arthrobacter methylotrophus]|uniref:hypothetical protein n=1 Tax=Arthrobacter methylotrophus TaxID=121291 RepID=UPI0031EBE964